MIDVNNNQNIDSTLIKGFVAALPSFGFSRIVFIPATLDKAI